MVNDRNIESTIATSGTRKRSSKAAKLVQAAALAAVLVPLGSVASEATTITQPYSGGLPTETFDFGAYKVVLSFETPSGPTFLVSITDNITTQGALDESSRLTEFPGFTCVPIADGINNCVDFEVTLFGGAPLLSGPNTFTGFFDMTIAWLANTDGTFPNVPGDRIRILHNEGEIAGDGFDSDITTIGSYLSGSIDPAIGGRDDNFQSFLVAQAPTDAVPEPATLLLVTSGVSGLLYRRRRRS